jgi:DNA-binding response OmpR family regulator
MPLSPIEARLAQALVEHFGTLVTNDELNSAGWPDEAASATALRVHVMRLRRQLAPLGLELRTVRSFGRVLEARTDSPGT